MSAVAHQVMENIHGVDVSWIHSSVNKDSPKVAKNEHSATPNGTQPVNGAKPAVNGSAAAPASKPADTVTSQPKQIPQRPGMTRNGSNERTPSGSLPKSASPGTSRRNSWLSSISSKFSSSPSSAAAATVAASGGTPLAPTPEEREPRPAAPSAPKNAILPHGQSPEGTAPYTPVPTRSGHPNFLTSALRRLSSSGGQLSSSPRHGNGGICPRKVLNVDKTRERCQVPELDQSKLRRVAFCVDVEIASTPRYSDDQESNSVAVDSKDKNTKKKLAEKGEGAALKKPVEVVEQKEKDGVIQASGEHLPKEPEKESSDPIANGQPQPEAKPNGPTEQTTTKKKEKKKRSEEERKARKEKKRKLAEENGQIPVEMVRSDSDSSTPGSGTPKSTSMPTTDPVRIYRRCCQLRETPILKKITEQLASPSNLDKPGFVSKLDLTDCWLQLPDLMTLGDYLAVVPVKELVMENCGLTDEGVRVILAGLLAAATPDHIRRKSRRKKEADQPTARGAVHRVVFKNNPKIGRDGWRHISLFINMSRSLKCLDVSMIPFPQPVSSPVQQGNQKKPDSATDPAAILSKAIATRLAGPELELLNIAAAGLTSAQIGLIIDGIIASGLKRLGLAENNINAEGVAHVIRWLKQGKAEGLDLGCNDLNDHLETIANALDSCEDHPLFALSIANCDLTPDSLWKLFPALAKLKNFRFIDLSSNHNIFAIKPSAVYLLRKFLPKMESLKRIHLTDCSMSPEQAIALAEIFPDSPGLAHVNLLQNPALSALADATDEANQEEACALYASLMAAVRVSKSLICIDIEVPSPNSSEVVKALAKQVIAYSLRNMERGPITEIAQAVPGLEAELPEEKEVELPEVLAHLVGRDDAGAAPDDNDDTAPDEDYVIGGTGVVKALGICLKNRTTDSRRPSIDRAQSDNAETASIRQRDGAVGRAGKAKDMSKNLLGSARKIRARLQPALLKESRTGDRNNYRKLLFLDETLERMIQRFEDEYPETRLQSTDPIAHTPLHCDQPSHIPTPLADESTPYYDYDEAFHHDHFASADEDEEGLLVSRPMLSRHNSDVSLASKAQTQEEGRMHRFGQKFRRDIIDAASPPLDSSAITSDQTTAGETNGATVPHNTKWAPHLEVLRAMLEEMGGEEIKKKIEETGQDELLKELGEEAGTLRQQLIEVDPEGWARFTQAQEVAMSNMRRLESRRSEDGEMEAFPVLEN